MSDKPSASPEAGAKQPTHHTKHRKEVKRYHQRQLNMQLREEAKQRDAQLFLFERSTNDGPPGESAAQVNSTTRSTDNMAVTTTLPSAAGAAATTQKEEEKENTVAPSTTAPKASTALSTLSARHPQRDVYVTTVSPSPDVQTVESRLANPQPVIPFSDWDFDFVLRSPAHTHISSGTTTTASAAGQDISAFQDVVSASAKGSPTALVPSSQARSQLASPLSVTHNRHETSTRSSTAAAFATTTTGGARTSAGGTSDGQRGRGPDSASEPIGVLQIFSAVTSSISKILNHTEVERVNEVPPLPMQLPLPEGTDLNQPPRTYLTLDPVHNIHQHAPGFLRDQQVALQHMLAAAMMDWHDLQQNALIVTSAAAMRSIFEQVYTNTKPCALRIRRVGPTIVIDSSTSTPTQVTEMHAQALHSKTLYRIKETGGCPTDERAIAQMALALPERRLSSVMASDPAHHGALLHRYSQLLRWRIDGTEVFLGNDAAIVKDERSGNEQLVRLKAADGAASVESEQRETLRYWFEAMMTNIPYVGTYIHCDGMVLSYQVKKTSDMLGFVEARMAAAALSFTSTVLQWLVKHCTQDGGTYAMVRHYSSDYVALYELPDLDSSADFLAETGNYFSASPMGPARGTPYTSADATPHLNRFSLNFALTCFRIGQHLYRDGNVRSAGDALTLLHRSFRIFQPFCGTEPRARETVAELLQMVGPLVTRTLQRDVPVSPPTATSASCAAPELYRSALLRCGSFEVPLRRGLVVVQREDDVGWVLAAFYARCLVTSSAAVCAVASAALEAYYGGCHHLRVLRQANRANNGSGSDARDSRDEVMGAVSSNARDVLQVVVEALVRLEETVELVQGLHTPEDVKTSVTAVSAITKEEQSSAGDSSSPPSSTTSASSTGETAVRSRQRPKRSSASSPSAPRTSPKTTASATAVAVNTWGTLTDPRTQVDLSPLHADLCELYGDVVVTAMADAASGFTTRALAELGAELEARDASKTTPSSNSSARLPTTLQWVTSLNADVVSLSFTALRFYGRIPLHTRRHLIKLTQVYYLVGKEHHRTARYTKALEALHRAKSLLYAMEKAPDDVVFGATFGKHGMVRVGDVMRLLGDVYRSVAERKLEAALVPAARTLEQPLLVGPLHRYPVDADTFFTQALSSYALGGEDEGCRAAKSCALLLYASVCMEREAVEGKATAHVNAQRIAALLHESETLTGTLYEAERRWQTLRLFTLAGARHADGALTRAAEAALLNPVDRESDDGGRASPSAASLPSYCCVGVTGEAQGAVWVDVDVADAAGPRREQLVMPPACAMLCEMQKALVCCVMVERGYRKRTADPRETTLLRWIGRAAGYLSSMVQVFLDGTAVWRSTAARHQWQSTLRTWGERTVGGYVHRLACMIALRVFNAAQGQLVGSQQIEARGAVKAVAGLLEAAPAASVDSDESHAAVTVSLQTLRGHLIPFAEW